MQDVVAVLALLAGVAWIVVAHPGVWAAAAATLLAPAFLARSNRSGRQLVVLALTVGMIVAAIDYVSWRVGVTNWAAWWLSIPLLAAEVFGILHAVGLMQTVWPRRSATSRRDAHTSNQPIFILVPTVNEGVNVLAGTLTAAKAAKTEYLAVHPAAEVRIVVCNDGRVAGFDQWMRVEEFAIRQGVEVVTRTIGGGAKAGNLENARQLLGVTGDAVLVIFDADQQARSDFLLRTVHELDDSRVAWVQTGQYYSNLTSPVALWAEHQQAIFYSVLLPGKSTLNAAFICGTNVVIRAAALDEIGGFPQDSVTEDFAASLELHKRWRSVFVPGKLAVGLGPMDLPAYFKQQDRWAVGTLGTLRTHFTTLITPRRTGMSGQQRVQYLLAQTHYLSGLKDLVFVLAPIVFLLTGVPAVSGANIGDLFTHFLPYFVLSQAAFWLVAGRVTTVRGILIGFASFPTLVLSVVTVITGRKVAFRITSKQRTDRIGLLHLAPHAVGFVACAIAIVAVTTSGSLSAAEIVTIFWVTYTGLMFGGVLYLGARDIAASRHAVALAPVRRRLSPKRIALVGIAAAAAVVLVVGIAAVLPTPDARAFAVSSTRDGALQLGASLPGATTVSSVAKAFPSGLDVAGRTQSIDENFDSGWADDLSAQGSTPWLTLVLSGRDSKLDSGLLAMANGVDDAAITRWATSLRDFGKPVYLTMLPAVDEPWAATSAVAAGSKPADVAHAWNRLTGILDKVGAHNVALAWAPALPSNDERFAPPESQIDVVVVTMYSYPGQQWADPKATFAATEARHPGKPILADVTAAGDPTAKATWLRSVATAAVKDTNVLALVYHNSDPAAGATGTVGSKASDWLISSDHQSQNLFAALDSTGRVPSTTTPIVSAPTVNKDAG